jgi:uncharacterized protein YbjT (DUF2867 family)
MIVVTIPTGKIGSQLVPSLLAANQRVRVVVRDPAKLPPEIRERAEIIQGAADDARVVDRALEGADALFWVVPPGLRTHNDTSYYLEFSQPACRAIERYGVPRVVSVSSLGRGLAVARDAGPVTATHAKDAAFEATGAAYRALWCPGFMENLLGQVDGLARGVFGTTGRGDLAIPHAATRDIAAMAARLLLDRTWTGAGGVAVLGPEDLSYDDIATILTDVLGRPIRYQQVPVDAYVALFQKHGATEALARGVVAIHAAVDRSLYNAERRTAENTTPTSVRQWATEVLKPALQRS